MTFVATAVIPILEEYRDVRRCLRNSGGSSQNLSGQLSLVIARAHLDSKPEAMISILDIMQHMADQRHADALVAQQRALESASWYHEPAVREVWRLDINWLRAICIFAITRSATSGLELALREQPSVDRCQVATKLLSEPPTTQDRGWLMRAALID